MRLILLLSVLLMCQTLPALSAPLQGKIQLDDSPPLSGEARFDSTDPTRLPAGATFSETVLPVSADLKVHKLFSSVTLPGEDKDDLWYQIPKWRAGFFHRDKQIDHTLFGDHEEISKVDHLYGMQVDKRGGIWHHVSWPSITKLSLDGYSQYKMINKYEPIVLSEREFCVKIYSTNVDVDDKTGKIIRTAKQEEFDRYFPDRDGVARGECFIQGFSSRGNQNTTVERCSVEEVRTQPFRVVNTFRGKDLRESFKSFLRAHDLAELAPD